MRKLLYIFLLTILTLQTAFSQSITWQRTYGAPGPLDDIGYDVCEADGNNFYIVGYTVNTGPNLIYVIKINEFGDTIWTRTVSDPYNRSIRALAVVSSNDGGCVLTGSWDSSFTIKFAFTGNIVWQKFYGGHNIQCFDLIKTSDSGYLACGEDLNANRDGYILKVDSVGELQWQKIIPSTEIRIFYSIAEETDRSYILVGTYSQLPTDPLKAIITKIDSLGGVIWEKTFQINNFTTRFSSISKFPNSYYVGGAYYYNQQFRVYFAKLDLQGTVVDTILFNSTHNEYTPGMINIAPDRFVFISTKDTAFGIPSFGLIRVIDSSGNIIRQKSYSWINEMEFLSVHKITNGDLIFVGDCKNPLRTDVYALRTDSLLNAPSPIGINPNINLLPNSYYLYQNFPNPFNPITKIKFDIPSAGYVSFKVFDVVGREVYTVNEFKNAGSYEVKFDGSGFASAMYFYKIVAGDFTDTKKMVLIK